MSAGITSAEIVDGLEDLEELFVGHLRARMMLKDVAKAEKEVLFQIVQRLKTVPRHIRRRVVVDCVEKAAASLVL